MSHKRTCFGRFAWRFLLALVALVTFTGASARAFTADQLQLIEEGFTIFTTETFDGNGRTCGTCHIPAKSYNIGPADIAELSQAEKDLVFASSVPALENQALVEKLALFNVNEEHAVGNVDEPEGPFRASMTIAGLAFTSENMFCTVPDAGLAAQTQCDQSEVDEGVNDGTRRTEIGWSGDGTIIDPDVFPDIPASADCRAAIDELTADPTDPFETVRAFSLTAVKTHFPRSLDRIPGVDFRCPTSHELDALAAFQMWLKRRMELDLTQLVFNKDPIEKGAGPGIAEEGKEIFLSDMAACSHCHFNAGANDSLGRVDLPADGPPVPGANKNSHTSTDLLRIRETVLDDLVSPVVIPRDPGDKVLNGGNQADGLKAGGFNVQSLIEAPRKKGFFHNNGFTTSLEDALGFYFTETFDKSQSSFRVRRGLRGGLNGPEALAALGGSATLNKLGFFLRALSAVYSLADCERLVEEMIQRTELGLSTDLPAMHCQFNLDDVQKVLEGAKVSPLPYSSLLGQIADIEAELADVAPMANAATAQPTSQTEVNGRLHGIIGELQKVRTSIAETPELASFSRASAPALDPAASALLALLLLAFGFLTLRRVGKR